MFGVALYNCRAEAAEDLEFQKNDIIVHVEPVSDGWYRGTLKKTGQQGIFPGNYVEFKDDVPPSLPGPRPQNMKSSAGDLSGRPQSIVDKPPTLGSRQSPQVPARPAEQQQQQQRNKPPVPVRAPVQAPTVRSSDSKPPMSPIAADSEYKSIQCPRFIMENDFRKFVKMFEKEDSDQDGFLLAQQVKPIFVMSQLPKDILARVWTLSDFDGDGKMSVYEFIVGMWLISSKVNDGIEVPQELTMEVKTWLQSSGGGAGQPSNPMFRGAKDSFSNTRPLSFSSSPVPSPSLSGNKGSQKQASNAAATPTTAQPPSKFEMYKYSRTDEGKELVNTTQEFAKSDTGKAVAGAAWERRDDIAKAAQSEAGQKVIGAAWENRDKVGKAAVSGMKMGMK